MHPNSVILSQDATFKEGIVGIPQVKVPQQEDTGYGLDDPFLPEMGCTGMSLAAQPTVVTTQSVSRHCLWAEGRGEGNLPWPRTIALDQCGTFLKTHES